MDKGEVKKQYSSRGDRSSVYQGYLRLLWAPSHTTGTTAASPLHSPRLYVSAAATLTIVPLGTEVTVTLFQSEQSTILSGPTIVAAYHASTFYRAP